MWSNLASFWNWDLAWSWTLKALFSHARFTLISEINAGVAQTVFKNVKYTVMVGLFAPREHHTHSRLTAIFFCCCCCCTQVSRYQKGKTNLDFTEARDSEWQWHQLEHMQVCTSLQTDNHARTSPLSFLQAGCPSCRPTNRKGIREHQYHIYQ